MELKNIAFAIKALCYDVANSSLPISEKNALKKLLDKLVDYYTSEYNNIMKSFNYGTHNYKLYELISKMTDYIVIINDTIHGKNDVYSVINMIFNEINYDDKKGLFKRKRLI